MRSVSAAREQDFPPRDLKEEDKPLDATDLKTRHNLLALGIIGGRRRLRPAMDLFTLLIITPIF